MNRKTKNRMQSSYIMLMLTTLLNSIFQRKWVQYLLVLLLVIAVASTLYHYRSSYVAVDLPDTPGIPPDPGRKANNRTLLGIDSDEDGVRDDVQRYILALDIDHPFFKRGLHQYAKSMQIALSEAYLPEHAQENQSLTVGAASCAYAASIDDIYKYTRELDQVIINTRERRSAHINWIRNIPFGMLYSPNTAQESCDFDVNQFDGKRWK